MIVHLLANEVGPGLRVGQYLSIRTEQSKITVSGVTSWFANGGEDRLAGLRGIFITNVLHGLRDFQTSGLSSVLRTEAMMNKHA